MIMSYETVVGYYSMYRPPFTLDDCFLIVKNLNASGCIKHEGLFTKISPELQQNLNKDYVVEFVSTGVKMKLDVKRVIDIGYIANSIMGYYIGGDGPFWEWVSNNFSNVNGITYPASSLKQWEGRLKTTTDPPDNARIFVRSMNKIKTP